MYRIKVTLILLIIAGFAVSSVSAFSPTLIGGTTIEHIRYSDSQSLPWYRLYGIGSWRTTLAENGYAAVNGNAELSYTDSGAGSFTDSEALEGTLGFIGERGTTVLDIGFSSSIDDPDSGTVLNPEWSLEYTLSPRQHSPALEPYLRYSGDYLYQELASGDRLSHEAALGLLYKPSITRGYRLEVAGTGTYWNERYLFDSGGGETDTLRRDYRAAVEAEANGLAGYFADWSLIFSGGALFSNGNYYQVDLATLQADSYDAWFSGFEAEWSWSPSRSVQFASSLYTESRHYLHRESLNEDGSLGGELLSTVNTGARFEADWTPDDRVYFILALFGGKTFSNDSNYDAWSMGISGSIEYGF